MVTKVFWPGGRVMWRLILCLAAVGGLAGRLGGEEPAAQSGDKPADGKPAARDEKLFRPLFNGKDFDGWEASAGDAKTAWKVADGCLVCTGKAGPWLRSREEYGDFELRLEYKVAAGGNSGVYVRVPKDGDHHGAGAGIEVQLLDDQAKKHRDLKPYQYTGSLYAIAPATKHVGKPAGEWNSLSIECQGKRYRVVHNSELILDADDRSQPELKGRKTTGYLGLQNHRSEIWFRNVRIASLGK